MSMLRLKSYEGRYWALKLDDHGVTASVHHFSSEEIRDGWVQMDPELRIAVAERHRDVRKWLAADPERKKPWYTRLASTIYKKITGRSNAP